MRKTALITGSGGGLAVAFAKRLAALGCDLALNYRQSEAACERLAHHLTAAHDIRATAFQADMTDSSAIESMLDDVLTTFEHVDILIHSAGPFMFTRKRLPDYSHAEWNEMINGNLSSAFYLFRRLIPRMRPNGYGRIVTVGFDRVEQASGWIYRSAYAAAKTGLASLTRTISQEERENGITANMICPGDIRGSRKESEKAGPDRSWRKPLGADLADTIAFLISPEARFVTGNIISLTGGVDVLGRFDAGKPEVNDPRVFSPGQAVFVIPWNRQAVVASRQDRVNMRSLYTVLGNGEQAVFTVDQLVEVSDHGV